MVTAQKLRATVSPTDSPITVIQGSSTTLQCTFTVDGQTPATCDIVQLFWVKQESDGERRDFWHVDSFPTPEQNAALVDLTGSELTVSAGSLTSLNSAGHSITFVTIEEEDEGQYGCRVLCRIGSVTRAHASPMITVVVKG